MPAAVKERTRLRLPALPRAAVVWLICLASTLAALLVCSLSSPLYATNDWIDANAYLTIGRAMLHGQVPYRDLVDHKGPLLYLLHMLAALVQPNGFFGVFVWEVAAGTVFCRWAVKLAALFADGPAALLAAPVSAAVVYTLPAFSKGDSAEEFALPLLLIALYDLTRVMLDGGRPVIRGMLLRNGALAGVLFWTKYTLLGVHFAFMACLFVELLAFRRQIARAFAACGWFLLGMAAPAVPVLAYFAANRALCSLWEVYFYNNLFRYSDLTGGVLNRLIRVEMLLCETLVNNGMLGAAFFAGQGERGTRPYRHGATPPDGSDTFPAVMAGGGRTSPEAGQKSSEKRMPMPTAESGSSLWAKWLPFSLSLRVISGPTEMLRSSLRTPPKARRVCRELPMERVSSGLPGAVGVCGRQTESSVSRLMPSPPLRRRSSSFF